jgi:hypothetical protein
MWLTSHLRGLVLGLSPLKLHAQTVNQTGGRPDLIKPAFDKTNELTDVDLSHPGMVGGARVPRPTTNTHLDSERSRVGQTQ